MFIIYQNLLPASIFNESDWAGKPQITLGANNGAGEAPAPGHCTGLPALPNLHLLLALMEGDQHYDSISYQIRTLNSCYKLTHEKWTTNTPFIKEESLKISFPKRWNNHTDTICITLLSTGILRGSLNYL